MNEYSGSLREKNDFNWRKNKIPTSGLLELTPRCTLNCKMCFIHLTKEQMGEQKELTTDQWIRIIDEAVERGMYWALLTGGECMLHEGFWEIYEHLRESGVMVAVNTNGLLLTDETIARFRENPPAVIRITLYGSDEESYERCTGARVYGRIMDNIRRLMQAGLRPRLALTISRYNAENAVSILQIGKDLGINVNYDMDLFEALPGTGRHSEDYRLTCEEMERTLREILKFYGRTLEKRTPLKEIPPLLPDDPDFKALGCAAGNSRFIVHWDGRIGACFDLDTEVNLKDTDFGTAWETVNRFAENYIQPVECRACKLRDFCSTCVVMRNDRNNPGHRNSDACKVALMRYNLGIAKPKKEEAVKTTKKKELACPND